MLPLLAEAVSRSTRSGFPSAAGVGLVLDLPLVLQPAVLPRRPDRLRCARRQAPRQSEEYTFPVASGIIAGGSLMGVIVVFWENGPQIVRQLFSGS